MSKLFFLLLASFIFAFVGVNAQNEHPLTNLPPSGQISTGVYFPEHPNKKFPTGELAKVAVNIRNEANKAYNITAIMGSIHPISDPSVYFYNFTQQIYLQVVKPDDELTVEYSFLVHRELPPRDYLVALTVFYEEPTGAFRATTFFNSTIDAVEVSKGLFDFQLFFLFVMFLAVLAGVAFLMYDYIEPYVKASPVAVKAKKSTAATPAPVRNDDEWVSGTQYAKFVKRRDAPKASSKSN
uniref:Translocon-associated protein subunit alpha n=1 Tax=Polytomella parva TaxID=51329 RepID=A0A7S0YXF5_9CHLO|mmetsp:Transcript_8877/g.16774  ORF Transcript_8877/g.16774 Transcript_8877/m.16774 type:complete len:239 (+) Transcript_8877:75-791(+)|eukprot:CAMPEP_0175055288 /NCGR_PEP_ID=MMETSP0052_2-20121109/9996_1 /TAXON_ID=51329 ORGANISM="Polytomella parva, Strain SAG 63-3" /NCGR_SAMPLE_ID=MMETSP0052_2 /ASSEMBLY_ACC=CAM_ASM_000194 /LENGTH=238 /DNA_ID=CAMNT_0016320115 /DNA_START=48 /DNA_END=764 /DNA_ORIENTATION=-